jgi:hypothetical protein
MEGKTSSIHRKKDSWWRGKGLIVLLRGKHKGMDGIRTQRLEREEARRAGATEQEEREKYGHREDLALICVG